MFSPFDHAHPSPALSHSQRRPRQPGAWPVTTGESATANADIPKGKAPTNKGRGAQNTEGRMAGGQPGRNISKSKAAPPATKATCIVKTIMPNQRRYLISTETSSIFLSRAWMSSLRSARVAAISARRTDFSSARSAFVAAVPTAQSLRTAACYGVNPTSSNIFAALFIIRFPSQVDYKHHTRNNKNFQV